MLRALGKYNLLLEGSAVRFLGVEGFFGGGGGGPRGEGHVCN